jgi:hypothetical protein
LLHLDSQQLSAIETLYNRDGAECQLFGDDNLSQQHAAALLTTQGLDIDNLDDLGNRWSKRWSTMDGHGRMVQARVLLQW